VLIIWLALRPPRFLLNLTKRADLSDPLASGQQMIEKYGCRGCHLIGGEGALVGPDLSGVATRLGEDYLRAQLRNPRTIRGDSRMPNLRISDSEITAIIQYLKSLDQQTPG